MNSVQKIVDIISVDQPIVVVKRLFGSLNEIVGYKEKPKRKIEPFCPTFYVNILKNVAQNAEKKGTRQGVQRLNRTQS